MKVKIIGVVFLAAVPVLVGCAGHNRKEAAPISRIWESSSTEPRDQPGVSSQQEAELEKQTAEVTDQPAKKGASGHGQEVIAMVNGEPVTRAELVEQLIQTHGGQVLEQRVLLIAARQRAEEMDLLVGEADIAAEHENALERIATPLVRESAKLDRRSAEQQLQHFLQSKNISRQEWDNRMRRLAYLRKIARVEVGKMKITEEMLRQEYDLAYGERVQVRHLQVSSLAKIRQARAMLAAGKDFEMVAQQMSENPLTATLGGLLPPFTRHDPSVAPLIREAAFELKIGQISMTIPEGGVYHLFHLERRFPASDVKYEHVDKAKLTHRLRERLIRQRMNKLEVELFKAASVDIRHPELRYQYEQRRAGD